MTSLAEVAGPAADGQTPALVVDKVTKRFGGLLALDAVSLSLHRGQIHGLIGPNGSGKSTLFNVVCGQEKLDAGSVRLKGIDVTSAPPERVAQLGIARTFQIPRAFRGLSVRENVLTAAHLRGSVGILRGMFRLPSPRQEEARLDAVVDDVLDFVGLRSLAHRPAGSLSSGHARLLEVCRALATDPCILLMDEPAAGLSLVEADRVAQIIQELQSRQIAVLVVEHNMHFVMPLCDTVTVLVSGRKLAEGLPAAIRRNRDVADAYLGRS